MEKSKARPLDQITMEAEWKQFLMLMPDHPTWSPVQIVEMRKAFYGGYGTCLLTLQEMATGHPEKGAVTKSEQLLSEIGNFWERQVKAWEEKKNQAK